MKKILFMVLCMLMPSLVNASEYKSYSLTPSINYDYQNYEYVIDEYHVEIDVNEDNSYDITEEITAYFNVQKHGIIRSIPLKNTIKRLDGTENTNRARVKNLKVSETFTKSLSNGDLKVKIGNENYTITGKKEYTINYTYNIGKDRAKDYDEFYFNLIGTEWDTAIGNVTFTINMPKEFDEEKLGFSVGSLGSTYSDDIEYEVDGNTITGSYNGILDEYQGVTIRLELDDEYFVYERGIDIYLMYIIPVVLLIISVLLWNKYGKDTITVDTVEFYPPEGFNSLEVGYIYNGKAKNEDVVSLMVYLANKGYIKIKETAEKSLFSTVASFKITKLKEYDGDNINERLFLEGLFKKGDTVTSSQLTNSFYTTLNKILKNINGKENKYKIFEKTASSKRGLVFIFIIVSLISIIALPTLAYAGFPELFVSIGIILFYIPFFVAVFKSHMQKVARIFVGIFVTLHSMIFFMSLPLRTILLMDREYMFGFIFGIICIIGLFIVHNIMPKRTPYGNELYGKLKGFKNFLETAEKEKLESMVMQNPTYFFDILPYTYVLGVSDMWINKFETIALQSPEWYGGGTTFNTRDFERFMNSTMTTANAAMVSSPSSSGGSGGFSGGGSSGGGSGGGGGSSW